MDTRSLRGRMQNSNSSIKQVKKIFHLNKQPPLLCTISIVMSKLIFEHTITKRRLVNQQARLFILYTSCACM